LDSFVAQQYRWCEGSMSMMVDPHFHQDDTMTLSQRTCYWSGFLYYISTALNAVLGPLVVMAMVWFFPDEISSRNVLPLLGALAIWLVVYPAVTFGHWRFEVLRVQAIYGFAHLFCILDLIRGRAAEWIPTNMSPAQGHYRSHTARVRWTIAAFLCATQVGIAVGLAIGAARYGLERYWANVLLGLLNAYVFVPVAWLCLRAIRADREKIIDLTPSISPVAGLLSALL
jgi:cellulose synthase (UDP-forming)